MPPQVAKPYIYPTWYTAISADMALSVADGSLFGYAVRWSYSVVYAVIWCRYSTGAVRRFNRMYERYTRLHGTSTDSVSQLQGADFHGDFVPGHSSNGSKVLYALMGNKDYTQILNTDSAKVPKTE
jgi:hypothetical protein